MLTQVGVGAEAVVSVGEFTLLRAIMPFAAHLVSTASDLQLVSSITLMSATSLSCAGAFPSARPAVSFLLRQDRCCMHEYCQDMPACCVSTGTAGRVRRPHICTHLHC